MISVSYNMKRLIVLTLWCLSTFALALPFDALKQPTRPKMVIDEVAADFKLWSKSNASWKRMLITHTEMEALEDFSISGYRMANQYLHASETKTWGQSGEETKAFVRTLKSGLNKMPVYKGTTYRGTWTSKAMIEQLEIGDIVYESGFLSTSIIPEVARGFTIAPPNSGNRLARTLFKIKTNRRSFSIASVSDYSAEAEVVIAPSSYLKVTAIEKGSAAHYIALETVSPRAVSAGSDRLFNLYSGERLPVSRWQQVFCH